MSRAFYFADTWFWIGLLHEPDQHHKIATAVYKKIGDSQIVTSEMVLTEVLNVFRKFGPRWRTICCDYIDLLRTRAEIMVIGQTSDDGMEVKDRPVLVPDLLATVCKAVGVDHMRQNDSTIGRPIRLVEPTATPIQEVLS